ncbi:MAG: polysaccharide biosynthesis protein [Oscillospiraceae bacterium]|nr:polysaccharide biosynthesis protein [Oscillospiraceae bacterium]
MSERKKQSLLNGAIILVISTLVVKVIGVCFKMPLGNMLGMVGVGYFNSVYQIYTPIYAISMAGLPIAVSRMVAESVALNRYREARMTLVTARKIFLLVGGGGTLLMLLISVPYAYFISGIKTLPALVAVSPSILFCCYLSSYRGYYEGLRNMIPTAISQIIEAFGKLVIGLILAKIIMQYGESTYMNAVANGTSTVTIFGTEVSSLSEAYSATYPWAAAGAIMGVTLGAFISLIYLFLRHKAKGDQFTRLELVNSPKPPQNSAIAKHMITIAIPILMSSLVLNATNLIDVVTIQGRLIHAIETDSDVIYNMYKASIDADVANNLLDMSNLVDFKTYLYSAYNTALDFKNLVPMITVSLGVSALPALSEAWAVKDNAAIKSAVNTVVRISMLIALPAGIGIGVLSEPILELIYGRGRIAADIPMIAPVVAVFGFTTAIMSISTPLTNLLQAVGRTDIPVKTMLIAAVAKIICNFALVGNPKFNFYGAVIGTVLFYVINVVLNLIAIVKETHVRIEVVSGFLKPLFAAALCGAGAWAAHGLLSEKVLSAGDSTSIINGSNIALVIAIVVAVVIYALALLLIKGIAREDLESLPQGGKIAKILEKYKLLG